MVVQLKRIHVIIVLGILLATIVSVSNLLEQQNATKTATSGWIEIEIQALSGPHHTQILVYLDLRTNGFDPEDSESIKASFETNLNEGERMFYSIPVPVPVDPSHAWHYWIILYVDGKIYDSEYRHVAAIETWEGPIMWNLESSTEDTY